MAHTPDSSVEKQVLDVYQKENPSTYRIEEDEGQLERVTQFADRLYRDSLKILPQVFRDADLLELGCGTGERSMAYLRWGARGTFVDMNPKALDRAAFLFDRFVPDAQYELVESGLYDFDTDKRFDITLSTGVIHHTPDKAKAFAHQVSFLKPGGINVLGIGSAAGSIQRNMQRHIIYRFAGRDEEEIQRVASDLFAEHLERAERLGGRTRKAIIYDTYVNPKMDFVSVAEVLRWYRDNGLVPFTSWPPVLPAMQADNLAGGTDWRDLAELASYPEWLWATQREDDAQFLGEVNGALAPRTASFRALADAINDVQAETLDPAGIARAIESVSAAWQEPMPDIQRMRGFEPWLSELRRVTDALTNGDYEAVKAAIEACTHLFRGRQGLGLNYFVAIKQ